MVVETGLYEVLGVAPDANPVEIRRAYRRAALRVHPDRAGNTATGAFQRVQEAYATLYDAESRRVYDEFGAAAARGEGDSAATAAFMRARGKRVSKDDIIAYAKRYRFSDDEREDAAALFVRLAGAVARALDYIPYADRSDVQRLVAIFDECAPDADDDVRKAYEAARKKLVRKTKGVEPRVQGDHSSKEIDEESEGEELGDGVGDDEDASGAEEGSGADSHGTHAAEIGGDEDGETKPRKKRAAKRGAKADTGAAKTKRKGKKTKKEEDGHIVNNMSKKIRKGRAGKKAAASMDAGNIQDDSESEEYEEQDGSAADSDSPPAAELREGGEDEVSEASPRRSRRGAAKRGAAAETGIGKTKSKRKGKKANKKDDVDKDEEFIKMMREQTRKNREKFMSFVGDLEEKYKDDPEMNGEAVEERERKRAERKSAAKKGGASKDAGKKSDSATRGVSKRSGRITKTSSRSKR